MATAEDNAKVVKHVGRPRQGSLTAEEQGLKDAIVETAENPREGPESDFDRFLREKGPAIVAQAREAAKREIQERMLQDAELAKSGEWTVRDLARQLDIAPGFVLTINGKPYITKEGLLAQARRIGFDAIEATVTEPKEGWFESEARVWRSFRKEDYELLQKMVGIGKEEFWKVYQDLRRPTVAHGSANPENVKMGAMKAYIRELAETRAINRALRLFTGCGLVSVEELAEAGQHGVTVRDAATGA